MRKPFQFKQFSVQDENSAMKVGTDAVLLGAWKHPANSKSILDIGCGSGIIALMMAQKTDSKIDAIDIDLNSIKEAKKNFANSPWSKNLSAVHASLSDFTNQSKKIYDLILSNPPFFNNSLKSPIESKNLSKHTSALTHEELLSRVKNLISTDGVFVVIIPYDQMDLFANLALIQSLYCTKKLIIFPTPQKKENRIILEFSQYKPNNVEEENLTIRDNSGNFTQQYKQLTRDFYLNF